MTAQRHLSAQAQRLLLRLFATRQQKKFVSLLISCCLLYTSFQDLSLSEVAEIHGISRQGVHDLVRRCDKLLEGYENKLHLVERFVTLKSSVSELRELTKAYEKSRDDKLFGQIDRLCQTILEEL